QPWRSGARRVDPLPAPRQSCARSSYTESHPCAARCSGAKASYSRLPNLIACPQREACFVPIDRGIHKRRPDRISDFVRGHVGEIERIRLSKTKLYGSLPDSCCGLDRTLLVHGFLPFVYT